jgi:hypothetical protein
VTADLAPTDLSSDKACPVDRERGVKEAAIGVKKA